LEVIGIDSSSIPALALDRAAQVAGGTDTLSELLDGLGLDQIASTHVILDG
jgi:hypothetical protein